MFTLLAATSVLMMQAPRKLTEHISAASMFKNGYAVILREMDVSGSGEYMLDQIPQASLGTLWFSTSDGTKLTSVVNTEVPRSDPVSAQSIGDLLALNIGKRVTLYFIGQEAISGSLVTASGPIVVVKSGDQTMVVDRTSIIRVASPDTLTDSNKVMTTTRGLRFGIQSSGPGKIFMLSLERGMTWAPGYAVTLQADKKLEVIGKATVINDLEDLNGIETRFITGWPNVPYAGSLDPLIEEAARAVFAGTTGGAFGTRSGLTSQAPAAKDMSGFGGMEPAVLGGVQAEDLFFYRQPNVMLKKGDRGYFIVFTMDAPYDEVYTWDIDDFVQDAQYRPLPSNQDSEDVWHTIRFTNTSKQPFSTGPATIFKEGGIIGQDTMRYVPAGGKAELKITKAMDVSADQTEEEVTRERAVLKDNFNRATHDLVTLKGTLTMVNRKSEAITVRVRKSVTGEVVSSTPEAKVTKNARGLRDVNSHADLEWTQQIEPGKTLTLTYTYKVYIHV